MFISQLWANFVDSSLNFQFSQYFWKSQLYLLGHLCTSQASNLVLLCRFFGGWRCNTAPSWLEVWTWMSLTHIAARGPDLDRNPGVGDSDLWPWGKILRLITGQRKHYKDPVSFTVLHPVSFQLAVNFKALLLSLVAISCQSSFD